MCKYYVSPEMEIIYVSMERGDVLTASSMFDGKEWTGEGHETEWDISN